MKFFMVLAALVLSVGCTKTQVQQDVNTVACSLEGSVESLVSAAIGSQLACSNLTAVQADVAAQVSKLNVCTAATPAPALTGGKLKGPVGDVVCAPVVAALMGGALSKIPAAWGCTGGAVSAQAQAAILAACQKAL